MRAARLMTHKSKAFSLIEMLVVTFVVVVGFMAIMALVRSVISQYYGNKNQMLSVMIAQEGMELVRFVRDQNWMMGTDLHSFAENISNVPKEGDRLIFKIDSRVLGDGAESRNYIEPVYSADAAGQGYVCNLPAPDCCPTGVTKDCIKFPNNKVYQYSEASGMQSYIQHIASDTFDNKYQPTIFSRLIETTYHDNGTPYPDIKDDYLYVKVTVYWQDRGQQHYYTLDSYLTNYTWRY